MSSERSERSERSRRTRFAKLGATRLPGRRASRVRGDSHLDRPSVRVIVTDHSCHPEPMLVTLSLSKGGAIDLRSRSDMTATLAYKQKRAWRRGRAIRSR